ncbi:MAG: GNAT family N-acetyltransferase [Euzebya sp.]
MEGDSRPVIPRRLLVGTLVRLGAIREVDVDALVAWTEDGRADRLGGSGPSYPWPETAQKSWWADRLKSTQDHHFAIRLLDEHNSLVGTLGFTSIEWSNRVAELSITVPDPSRWGKGYGTEAISLAVEFGFEEMNLHRIQLSVFSYNTRALRAYERVGFVREGVLREYLARDGRRHDMIVLGLLAEEWRASRPT